MTSPVNRWILGHVAGLTFCDIGGIGLNSQNERITIAAKAGATGMTMIDYRRFGFPEWETFNEKIAEAGLTDVNMIDAANLEDREFPARVGQYDFVHCMGILYHAPAPLLMLDNLSRVTGRYLIVNTIILPDVVDNEAGRIELTSGAIFLPGINEQQRAILEKHYQNLLNWPSGRFTLFAPRIDDSDVPMPWLQTRADSEQHFWGKRGDLSYSPYWWLFTKDTFRAAVRMFGFRILDEADFKGHTLTLFCEH